MVELRELKPYILFIQILNEGQSESEHAGAWFVAVTLDDPTYDNWFTFSGNIFDDYDAAYAFVQEAGCEPFLED